MKQPLISFVIPTKDRAYCLAAAIRSCLEQTRKDVEVIVVDDHSTDYTEKLVKKIIDGDLVDEDLKKKAKGRVKYFRLNGKKGVSAARNYGNEKASGKYICVLDSDDQALPDRAKIVAKYFEKNNVDFMYGGIKYIYVDKMQDYPSEPFDRKKIKTDNFVPNSSVAYTKKIADKYKYDEKISCIDDYEYILRLAKDKIKFGYVKKILSAITITGDSLNMGDKTYAKTKKRLQAKYKNL
jgi:glycosyltransferase involved in cell wall biosynthesis